MSDATKERAVRRREPNIELLDATLAEVRKAAKRKGSPEKPGWDQRFYRTSCGTAMCFAGWAVTLLGYKWAADLPDIEESDPYGFAEEYVVARRGDVPVDPIASKPLACVGAVAARRLGLTEDTADLLFAEKNTLPDLTRIVRQIKAGVLR